jgi:hypothetical protein
VGSAAKVRWLSVGLGWGLALAACSKKATSDDENREIARVVAYVIESHVTPLLAEVRAAPLQLPTCPTATSEGCSRWCTESNAVWNESCEAVGDARVRCGETNIDWRAPKTSFEGNLEKLDRAIVGTGYSGLLQMRIRHHSEILTMVTGSTVPKPRALRCEGLVTLSLTGSAVTARTLKCKDWFCEYGTERVDCSDLQRELAKIPSCS